MQHRAPSDAFRVIALIAAYNEEDAISSVIDASQARAAELERALGREEGRAGELESRVAELGRDLEAARRPTGWFAMLRRLFDVRERGHPE